MTRPAHGPARRRVAAWLAVALSAAAILATWAWSLTAPRPAEPLPADRAEVLARRVGVAFADAGGVWRRLLRAQPGRGYDPVALVLFAGATPSACAGGPVSGPFYCRASRTAAFDLAFLADLDARLRRRAELGGALLVGRIAAEHVQGELGLLDRARRGGGADAAARALHADCLTGVWAAASAGGLGPVPPGFYGELTRIAGNVAEDRTRAGAAPPAGSAIFAAPPQAHEAAFLAGYAGGGIADCPAPAVTG